MAVNKIKLSEELQGKKPAKDWDNPSDPENIKDKRDTEQLLRQKKEAERRKNNLSDDSSDDANENKKD